MTVTRLVLSPVAVARTRFAWSPLAELLGALHWVQKPIRARGHVPWLVTAAAELSPADRTLLTAAVPGTAVPPFLLPTGSSGGSVYQDLAEVQRASPETVLAQYRRLYPDGLPDPLAPLADAFVPTVQELVAAMARAWHLLVEPALAAVQSCISAELRARERSVAHEGLAATVDRMSDALSWCGDSMLVAAGGSDDLVVAPGGLRLLPSVLVETVRLVADAGVVTVLYPAHGRRTVWDSPYEAAPIGVDAALSSLLGPQRARIVAELVWPRGTTALARRLGLSAGVVSRHLSVLEAAGLVRRTRDGRRIVCSLTSTGADLVAPPHAAGVLGTPVP